MTQDEPANAHLFRDSAGARRRQRFYVWLPVAVGVAVVLGVWSQIVTLAAQLGPATSFGRTLDAIAGAATIPLMLAVSAGVGIGVAKRQGRSKPSARATRDGLRVGAVAFVLLQGTAWLAYLGA